MKRIGIIGTAVLSLSLGVAAPVYAQQEQRDKQEEEKAKPAQEEKQAQPEKSAKQEEKPAGRQENAAKPEDKNAKQQDRNAKDGEKTARQHEQQGQGKQERASGSNGLIPEDRYKANFGQQHRFHVSQADYSRDRRFQYGGYWFGFVDPWPSNWVYTQDVYVVEINGVYYLCNPMYPGVNILLSVTL